MKKLRFKNREGVLYFGIGGKFKSSKMKDTKINRNIIISKHRNGELDEELGFKTDKSPTLLMFLDKVLQEKRETLKKSSIEHYSNSYRRISAYFEDKAIEKFKPIEIKEFQDKLAKKYSRSLINNARTLLREAFDLAVLSELINVNPVVSVRPPKFVKPKKKQNPFTLDEIDLILENSQGFIRNFFGISFFTGMRGGEILALKWDDVDFYTDTISVTKTVSRGVINSTKTQAGTRDIEMIPQARKFFEAQRLETGLQNSFVFLQSDMKSYHGSNVLFYKYFKRLIEKLGLEDRAMHNTRHTFASIMLNHGIEPLWVSATLGHKSLDVTLGVYTHYMPRKEKMVIGFLEKRYKTGTHHS
ncbi:MAG: tyrosine-type recombinase/integrase [Sulfurimonas sp.]|uniref:tyrosine-type recombinase/integrase n=1 Tax=Sulfurimonas sp. TaxID=2022749 RepID=UPI0025E6C0C3|nr:site-specific integrase [Sulfurimonas sp.]MCK9454444.1 site-specific integrase [Sulfurimonas sp.]